MVCDPLTFIIFSQLGYQHFYFVVYIHLYYKFDTSYYYGTTAVSDYLKNRTTGNPYL